MVDTSQPVRDSINQRARQQYSYIGNNPLSGVDPTGYMSVGEGCGAFSKCDVTLVNPTWTSVHLYDPQALKSNGSSPASAGRAGVPSDQNSPPQTATPKTTEHSIRKWHTAGDYADKWDNYRLLYRQWLASRLTPQTAFSEKANLAALTLSIELGAGLVDTLRLGQGASEGGLRGWAQDGIRAVSLGLMAWGASRSARLGGGPPPDPPISAAGGVGEAAAGSPTRIYSAQELLRRAEESGPYHNFPESLNDPIFEQGTRTATPDFWKKAKTGLSNDSVMYKLPGRVNGVSGTFEIGVRPSLSGNTEVIMHRFFRPNP